MTTFAYHGRHPDVIAGHHVGSGEMCELSKKDLELPAVQRLITGGLLVEQRPVKSNKKGQGEA